MQWAFGKKTSFDQHYLDLHKMNSHRLLLLSFIVLREILYAHYWRLLRQAEFCAMLSNSSQEGEKKKSHEQNSSLISSPMQSPAFFKYGKEK